MRNPKPRAPPVSGASLSSRFCHLGVLPKGPVFLATLIASALLPFSGAFLPFRKKGPQKVRLKGSRIPVLARSVT